MENAGQGSRRVENAGSAGKRGVWKTRGLVEKAGSGGKGGVWWKTQGLVEDAGLSGKHRVPLFSPNYELSSLEAKILLAKLR